MHPYVLYWNIAQHRTVCVLTVTDTDVEQRYTVCKRDEFSSFSAKKKTIFNSQKISQFRMWIMSILFQQIFPESNTTSGARTTIWEPLSEGFTIGCKADPIVLYGLQFRALSCFNLFMRPPFFKWAITTFSFVHPMADAIPEAKALHSLGCFKCARKHLCKQTSRYSEKRYPRVRAWTQERLQFQLVPFILLIPRNVILQVPPRKGLINCV